MKQAFDEKQSLNRRSGLTSQIRDAEQRKHTQTENSQSKGEGFHDVSSHAPDRT